LSTQLLYGNDGGVAKHFSDLSTLSNFTSFTVPYPIITSLGVKTQDGECLPGPNATQYEFSPYEFGSFDQGVAAFANTKYLGSSINNGKPVNNSCVTGFDNTGLILGTSSNLFNEVCAPISGLGLKMLSNDTVDLLGILNTAHEVTTRDEYAAYPNPFFNYSTSSLVSSESELHLVDGGEALQNNPIWPFLHRSSVDVLIVNDNSADTTNNYPNGSEILTTYVQAQSAGLTRMPAIPSVGTFISQGLNVRPTFFGCNSPKTMTIIYMPNTNYTYNSGQSTTKLQYSEAETRAMVANGVQIGTMGGNATWPQCLACGIMTKSGVKMPKQCEACLQEFCYN